MLLIACSFNWVDTTRPTGWLLGFFLTWLYNNDQYFTSCLHQQIAMFIWQEGLIVKSNHSLFYHSVGWLGWLEIVDFITTENDTTLQLLQESWSHGFKKKTACTRVFSSGACVGPWGHVLFVWSAFLITLIECIIYLLCWTCLTLLPFSKKVI